MRTLGFVAFLAASVVLIGCTSARRRCCPRICKASGGFFVVVPAPPAPEPVPYATEETTPWAYLAAKYDKDGDGTITAEERGRDEAGFKRLDANKDGALTASDFEQVERMYQMIAQMTLLRYFQDDDQPRDLHREELQAAFARHDADKDGVLTQAEMAAARAAVSNGAGGAPRMPAGIEPYGALLAVADGDKNGAVTLPELESFFDARDDGDGKWALRSRRGPGMRPPGGVAPGEPAPDFTLRTPDGRDAITLSDFKGTKPVALIFGSYT